MVCFSCGKQPHSTQVATAKDEVVSTVAFKTAVVAVALAIGTATTNRAMISSAVNTLSSNPKPHRPVLESLSDNISLAVKNQSDEHPKANNELMQSAGESLYFFKGSVKPAIGQRYAEFLKGSLKEMMFLKEGKPFLKISREVEGLSSGKPLPKTSYIIQSSDGEPLYKITISNLGFITSILPSSTKIRERVNVKQLVSDKRIAAVLQGNTEVLTTLTRKISRDEQKILYARAYTDLLGLLAAIFSTEAAVVKHSLHHHYELMTKAQELRDMADKLQNTADAAHDLLKRSQ